ncbi:MAG: hypothetical protein AB8B84_16040 [Granulosicoccus sp.]
MNDQLLQDLSRLTALPSITRGKLQQFFVAAMLSGTYLCLLSLQAQAEQPPQNTHSIASQTLAALPVSDCLLQLDATVALASNDADEHTYLDQRFAALESRCPNLPQIAHNRGVLAAKASKWFDAIDHFNRSLLTDTRAAMTHRHLQQIYEHRAAQAYAQALNTPIPVRQPILSFQLSTDQNAVPELSDNHIKGLRTNSTVEYEMYAWWQALQSSSGAGDFYVQDFPASAIEFASDRFNGIDWDDIQREIAFTENDAVVVLSDPQQKRTLLLMRLVATRWKIYQETPL